jgi:uncharacterized membrane protein
MFPGLGVQHPKFRVFGIIKDGKFSPRRGVKMSQNVAIALGAIIGAVIAFTLSAWWGVYIAIAGFVHNTILDYGRSEYAAARTTIAWATFRDIFRLAIFVIPLIIALIQKEWLIAVAIFVTLMINTFTKYPEPKKSI